MSRVYLCKFYKMQHRFSAFFFLLLFVLLSANRGFACGESDVKQAVALGQKSGQDLAAHSKETVQSHVHCTENLNHGNPSRSGQPCPEDESGHCHCPDCGAVNHPPVAISGVEMAIPMSGMNSASVLQQAFYFADHLPEAVHLPIWQPPKWVA